MAEYDEATLKKLQESELLILKDFIKICDENDLCYFGFAGTGIGALRHKGFIPWDDDIDVAILREDHDRLLSIIEKDYADKYYVITAEKDPHYPLATTRICIKDSVFVEEPLKSCKSPLGIFLDVYPLDVAAADDKALKKQAYTTYVWSKLLILKHLPFPYVAFKGFKRFLAHSATAVVWLFLNLFCISHKFLCKKVWKSSRKYENQSTGRYAFFCGSKPFNVYYGEQDIYPLKKLPFEDIELNFAANLEKSLEVLYGDYMQLPPPEKRKNHYPFALKFPDEYRAGTRQKENVTV